MIFLGKRFCHRAHLDFNNPRARALFAGQQNRFCHIFRLKHIRFTDAFFGASPSDSEFGLYASGTDNANLDSANSEFLIQGLHKTDLRKLRGTIHRFAPKPIVARHRRNHQDGALLLFKHDRNRVSASVGKLRCVRHKRLTPIERSARGVVFGVIRISQRLQIEWLKFSRLRNKRLVTCTDQREYYCFHMFHSFFTIFLWIETVSRPAPAR
jgi:hypothetical protein